LVKEGFVRVFDGKPEVPTYRYIRGNEKQPDKDHPVQPGLPDVFADELNVQPVSLPQQAWYPALRRDFQDEDLAAARKAVANAEAALKKAVEAAEKEDQAETANDEPKKPAITVAESRLAVANAELESLHARW